MEELPERFPPARWIVAFLSGCFLSLAAAEVLLRTFLHLPSDGWVANPYGKTRPPYEAFVQSSEGYSRGQLNRFGQHDNDDPADGGDPRILCVGDSQTEAMQVATDESFVNQLEELLPGAIAINASWSAWSPANAMLFLQNELETIDADIIVLQVWANDLSDLERDDLLRITENADSYSLEVPRKAPKENSPVRSAHRWLMRQSSVYNLAVSRALGIVSSEKKRLRARLDPSEAGADDSGDSDPREGRAEQVMSWILAQIRESTEGRELVLLYLPSLDYFDDCADKSAIVRDYFAGEARAIGAVFVDTSTALCREFMETQQPLHGFTNSLIGSGHLNRNGHSVIARLLADEIEQVPAATRD